VDVDGDLGGEQLVALVVAQRREAGQVDRRRRCGTPRVGSGLSPSTICSQCAAAAALAYYPHHPHGLPKRHAERHALLAHRNVCESLFNQLKAGGSLATVGADRMRLNDFRSLHALIDLNFCLGTALMLGYERDQLGVGYPSPWAEAAA